MFLIKYDKRKELSIHAPTRGATVVSLKCYIQIFFQSTLLQEERLVNFTHIGILNAFNPRSYKRSDLDLYVTQNRDRLSIHAPTRGATMVN